MPEWILLVLGLAAAAAAVAWPLRGREGQGPPERVDEADRIRHRAAIEALRDVEADRRSGSLDDQGYVAALAEAEVRAAQTRAALEAPPPPQAASTDRRGRRWAGLAIGVIGLAVVVGSLVPATGLANETVDTRQERIAELTDALVADPSNTQILIALADAYLEGTSTADLSTAVRILQVVIQQDPEDAGAYERVIAAYIRAGDWPNARAALDDYATITAADPVEVAFLDGLVALQGEGDRDAAAAAFDRFLELAPDDPRADMVRSLRDEAASGE